PKGQTVNVTVAIAATDDSGDSPVCKLGNITGPGTAPLDYNVTGALTGTVRAIGGRTYAFNTICGDGSGNYSWSSVNVVIPADTTAPVVHGVTATPSTIWPPNDGLVPVTVAVAATDDVDDAPVCKLSGVTSTAGSAAADYGITGALSARVRSENGAVYSLNVSCSDRAGNMSHGVATVTIGKDPAAKSNNGKR